MARRFAKGTYAFGIDDKSGFKVPYKKLRTQWNGIRTTKEGFDDYHPQDNPPRDIVDAQVLRDPAPDADATNVVVNYRSSVWQRPVIPTTFGVLNFQPMDTYKIALYTPDATISRDTLVYTSSGEVSSTGYTAGGKTLTNFTFALTDEEHGIQIMIYGDDVEWTGVSFTTLYGLVYNSSNVNRVLAFLRFDQVPVHLTDLIVSNGSFKVILE